MINTRAPDGANKMTLKWTPTAAFCSDSFSFFFHQSTQNHWQILIRKKTGKTSSNFIHFQIGSQMLDWVETKYDVTIVSIRKKMFRYFLTPILGGSCQLPDRPFSLVRLLSSNEPIHITEYLREAIVTQIKDFL